MINAIHGVLSANLFPAAWLNLSPNSGVTLTSGKVSSVDLGSGFSAIQASDSLRPVIATVNGFNVFRFNGSCLKIPALPLGTFCMFLVFKATANGLIMEHSPNATPNPGHYIYTDINNSLQFTRNNTPPNEATFILDNYGGNWASDGALKVICLRVFTNSGGTNLLQFYKNSTTPSTVFSMVETPTVTDALFIGGRNESSAFVTMDLASMEVYQKLTDSQVSKKITDLMNTYNTF